MRRNKEMDRIVELFHSKNEDDVNLAMAIIEVKIEKDPLYNQKLINYRYFTPVSNFSILEEDIRTLNSQDVDFLNEIE